MTETDYAAGFVFTTLTSTKTWAYATKTWSFYSPATTETYTYTWTDQELPKFVTTTARIGSKPLITPACQLPSVVPECQSQWISYESHRLTDSFSNLSATPTPLCPLASIGTALCNDLKDLYITSWIDAAIQGPFVDVYSEAGYEPSLTTYPNGSMTVVDVWPTTKTLGPSCTLGCAGCAITGGSVRLLYWPATQTSLSNFFSTSTISDTTDVAGPIVASVFGTKLTSPTVYISFASIYASDSCSAIGTTHGATIIAVPTSSSLSSLYITSPDLSPHTAFFNFTDLNEPIPESIYTRQLRCLEYFWLSWFLGNATSGYEPQPNTCPASLGYEPIRKITSSCENERETLTQSFKLLSHHQSFNQ